MERKPGMLGAVYDLTDAAALQRHYDRWADSYDDELTASGYQTPQRCAEALARHAPDPGAPILDFACGTGLSGLALHRAGFTCIDGVDLSPRMLAQARKRGVYRHLQLADGAAPPGLQGGAYAAIAAVGAIGPGAAPGAAIDGAIDSLAPGALFVVSLNDTALADPDFGPRIARAAAQGRVAVLEAEDGPHLPALGLGARVHVLQRLRG